MADTRLVEIAKLLLEQTEARKVQWEKGASKGQFQTSFAKYSVVISGPADMPHLYLSDEDGDVIEDLSYTGAYQENVHEDLSRLYVLARRRALGADEALDEILDTLRKK